MKRIPDHKRKRVIELTKQGLSQSVIAERLGIAERSVENIRREMREKGGSDDR